jgi:hypothetical protein
MKRLVGFLLGAYLLLAVGNKVAEAAGARRCHCADECWCRRPGLSLFRWVFPWHTNAPGQDAEASSVEEP